MFKLSSKYYNLFLVGSFLIANITQSYFHQELISSSKYHIHPVIIFCYISLCISGYSLTQLINENNNSIYKTIKTLFKLDYKTGIQIIVCDSLADFLNTLPRSIKNLHYSSHAVIEKTDSLVSLIFAIFVRKNIRSDDFYAAIFTTIGILIYFTKIMGEFSSMSLLSLGTISIIASKIALEMSIFTEGTVVRSKKISENHVLFLTNIGAPITFIIGLILLPDIKEDVFNSFYFTFPLFLVTFLVILFTISIQINDIYLSFFMLLLGTILTPICLTLTQKLLENYVEYGMVFLIGSMWVLLMKIKMKCHAQNFSGITFTIMTAIIFTFKVTIRAPTIFDPVILLTLGFITAGTFCKSMSN